MMTRALLVTCGKCGEKTEVVERYWPATRYDPPDGVWNLEECPDCDEPFGDTTATEAAEPPDPY